jgi:hypothetical protein
MIAADTPCATRAATSTAGDHASPHASEDTPNRIVPAISTRRRPSRSPARPPSSSSPPKLSRYALSTHCTPSAENPRSRSIDGTPRITIWESRITMKLTAHNSARAFGLTPMPPALGFNHD